MDMEKLHDAKNLMRVFYIAYLDAFVPEDERQLLVCFFFFSIGSLIILKKIIIIKKLLVARKA